MKHYIEGKTGPWEMVIGLEVHAQVISNSKLFSGAPTAFGASPNSQVSFVDAAFPGMLPVLNEVCVEQAVKTGFGLNAEINMTSVFERKNYFYQDLPQGYQISQYLYPIIGKGSVLIDLPDGSTKTIGVTRLHLEQDAGKSLHDQHPNRTFVDLNRAGVALMEIVSEPEIRTAEEAGAYVKKLRSILRYIESCDGNMEQGNMRCDVNISLRRPGDAFGTRAEIKNVNSIRYVMQAIHYEAERQMDILEDGGEIKQETRLFDPAQGVTRALRSKEDAHDYRYFPDPDLLPLRLTPEFVDRMKAQLPELPDTKTERLMTQYGLTRSDALALAEDKKVAAYFENVAKDIDPKLAFNWVTGELFAILNKTGQDIEDCKLAAEDLNALLTFVTKGTLSGRMAKDVFAEMIETGKKPGDIIEEKGLAQVSDSSEIEKIVDQVLADNPQMVADYKSGKDRLFGFFVGQVMKLSQGKANPGMVNELLKSKIG